jgi:AGZA family xanthine/uracil permease-like MFS transporter
MLADAVATCAGALCGTSTVTTFVESSAGIAVGGKTGLTSMVTAVCFFVAMFFSPLGSLIPTCATSAALIYVGVLMMNCVSKVDWLNVETAVPAFATIAITVMTYSISYGIGLGLVADVAIRLCLGKLFKENKEGDLVTVIVAVLFLLMFLLTH